MTTFVIVTMHHIVSDGWSMGVLIREAATLYDAFRANGASPLPTCPSSTPTMRPGSATWLDGDVLRAQLDYWTGQLAGVPALDIPTDRPRPPALSGRGGTRSIVVPGELLEELQALGRKQGATLYMTLLAGFQVLLHRYSGQADVAVGSPIAGRTRSELEGLIGLFVNTIVLRGDLAGDPSFREFLGRVRAGRARGLRTPGPAVRADRRRPRVRP